MSRAEELRALEAHVPWLRDDFRAGLAALSDSTAAASRQYAADTRVLAELAAMVPRCPMDERGSTPWTSFRREVAVARKVSDRAAAALVRAAVRLTTVLPHTLDLLEAGVLPVPRAEALVTELEVLDDELAAQVDADLADRAALLPPWRIVQEVRRAAAALDPEASALRVAAKSSARGVELVAGADDQAVVSVFGPAVPLTRWYGTLDERARALKQAGDPRPLDALRFDLATSTFPCAAHAPADPAGVRPAAAADPGPPAAAAGLRPSFVEAAGSDCRTSRPVQAMTVVPVETALGLSNEPAWLDGYGWISAPTARQLLVDAELRRVCVRASTGELVDVAARDVRPPPTPEGVRDAVLDMVLEDVDLTDVGWRDEPQHDPSEALRTFVSLRDRTCDGPTGARVSSRRCDLDHADPYPHGPTAAWNLAARAQRTHGLKHYGWVPLRTPTTTYWTSPAGQVVAVPRHTSAPPGIDRSATTGPTTGPTGTAVLPDAGPLDALDRAQLRPRGDEDVPPWLPSSERLPATDWAWLEGSELAPF